MERFLGNENEENGGAVAAGKGALEVAPQSQLDRGISRRGLLVGGVTFGAAALVGKLFGNDLISVAEARERPDRNVVGELLRNIRTDDVNGSEYLHSAAARTIIGDRYLYKGVEPRNRKGASGLSAEDFFIFAPAFRYFDEGAAIRDLTNFTSVEEAGDLVRRFPDGRIAVAESALRACETGRPYTVKMPFFDKDRIFEAFMSTSDGERNRDDFGDFFRSRFPHLYNGGKNIDIEVDLASAFRAVESAKRKWIRHSTEIPLGGNKYTHDISRFVMADDPYIRKLAEQITEGLSEPEDMLNACVLFVQQFQYRSDPNPQNGDFPENPYAYLLAKGGDCEGAVILAASLAASLPRVRALGLNVVYAWSEAAQVWHTLIGVQRGCERKFKIDKYPKRKVNGLYLADLTKIGRFVGYSRPSLQVRHTTKL